jgi:hypothetical protein
MALEKLETAALVARFAEEVVLQRAALKLRNVSEQNRRADECSRIFDEIRVRGNSARDEFASLLLHSDEFVRLVAASFMLRHKHDAAMRVLRALANQEGMIGFGAEECMARWREGAWTLDPP